MPRTARGRRGSTIGALVEPLAVGVHATGRAAVGPGDRVLVIGGGSIGLPPWPRLGQPAWTSTSSPVTRTSAAREGSSAPARDLARRVRRVVRRRGTQSSLDDAVTRVRPGGAVVVVATYWEPVPIGAAHAHQGGADRAVGHVRPRARSFGVRGRRRVLAARPEVVDALVHHRFGLDDAPEAFRVAGDRATGAIKVLLEP